MAKKHWFPQHWMAEQTAGSAAPPTLTVTDNGNGTATATITGSTAGTTNTVKYQPVNGYLGTDDWTTGGSRVGNGSVTITLAAGYYWWRCDNVAGDVCTVSNLVYRNVTDGVGPVHYRCLQAVQAKIQSLSLSGIDNSRVVIRKLPTDRGGLALPCCIVSPPGNESMEGGTNERDDVGYPCAVTFVDAIDGDLGTTNMSRDLLWRQKAMRAVRNQGLSGVSEIYQVRVEPYAVIDPKAVPENLWVGSFLARCVSREVRGI